MNIRSTTIERVHLKYNGNKKHRRYSLDLYENIRINDGNKGIVAKIEDDEKMPFCLETGERAEIILNPLGVIGRLNMRR